MATARGGEGLAGRRADGEQLLPGAFVARTLGVVIPDPPPAHIAARRRVIEASDAFLRAAGPHRADVDAGLVGWSHAPQAGGPVETTFTRPDGTVVPVLVGGATVQPVPFRMVALVVDLTEPNRSLARITRLHALASAL